MEQNWLDLDAGAELRATPLARFAAARRFFRFEELGQIMVRRNGFKASQPWTLGGRARRGRLPMRICRKIGNTAFPFSSGLELGIYSQRL